MDTVSQNKAIRKWLEEGNSITPLSALSLFGCLRLSARIYDLKKSGMVIISEMVEIDGKRFAQYRKGE